MVIGACTVHLRIAGNQSLKGKRRVIKPIMARVRNQFNVAIAEVDDNDVWQSATLGIACVSNDAAHANSILSHVVAFIEQANHDAELIDYQIEIL